MKKINKIFAIILIIFGIYYFIEAVNKEDIWKIITSLCVPILVFIPNIFKIKINDRLVCIYYIYIFLLMVLGCLGNFYEKYKYYDLFAHFMFGFLSSFFGLYLLNIFKIYKGIAFNIIFIISITLSLASLWEIFEYFGSLLFSIDPQDVLKTGVRDTMEDVIAALISCVLFVITYVFKRNELDNFVK